MKFGQGGSVPPLARASLRDGLSGRPLPAGRDAAGDRFPSGLTLHPERSGGSAAGAFRAGSGAGARQHRAHIAHGSPRIGRPGPRENDLKLLGSHMDSGEVCLAGWGRFFSLQTEGLIPVRVVEFQARSYQAQVSFRSFT